MKYRFTCECRDNAFSLSHSLAIRHIRGCEKKIWTSEPVGLVDRDRSFATVWRSHTKRKAKYHKFVVCKKPQLSITTRKTGLRRLESHPILLNRYFIFCGLLLKAHPADAYDISMNSIALKRSIIVQFDVAATLDDISLSLYCPIARLWIIENLNNQQFIANAKTRFINVELSFYNANIPDRAKGAVISMYARTSPNF